MPKITTKVTPIGFDIGDMADMRMEAERKNWVPVRFVLHGRYAVEANNDMTSGGHFKAVNMVFGALLDMDEDKPDRAELICLAK